MTMASNECVKEMYAIARDHVKLSSRSLKDNKACERSSDTGNQDDDELRHIERHCSESLRSATQKRKLSDDIYDGVCGDDFELMPLKTNKTGSIESECLDLSCRQGDLSHVCTEHSGIPDHVDRDQAMDGTPDGEAELTHSERKENMQALDMATVLQHITQSGTPFEIIEMNECGGRNVSDVICGDGQSSDFVAGHPTLNDQLDDRSSSPVTCSISDDPVSSVTNDDQSLIVMNLFHALGEKPPDVDTVLPMDSPKTVSSGLNTPCVASPQPYNLLTLQSPPQLSGMICSHPVTMETQFNNSIPKGHHVRIDTSTIGGLQQCNTRLNTPICLVANSSPSDTLGRTFGQPTMLPAGGNNCRRTLIPIENWSAVSSIGQHVANQHIIPNDISKHGHVIYVQNNAANQAKTLYAYPQNVIAESIPVNTIPVSQHGQNTPIPINQHTANIAPANIQFPMTSDADQYNKDNDENSQASYTNDPPKSEEMSPDVKIEAMRILNPHLFQDLGDDDLGREQHNYKERIRRARIRDACVLMRQLVPGMSDKTDKATVFEFAARYIHYIKTFVGNKHDKFCNVVFTSTSPLYPILYLHEGRYRQTDMCDLQKHPWGDVIKYYILRDLESIKPDFLLKYSPY